MRILFAGTPDVGAQTLTTLASEHEIVGILTQPDRRAGRGRKVQASPIAQLGETLGIPVYKYPSLRDPQVQQEILALGAELAVVVAYGNLIPAALLTDLEWINLHFSLLPRWRGAAPVQYALAAGDEITGVSIFRIEAGLDTGPTYAVDPLRIAPDQTAATLLPLLAQRGAQLMQTVVAGIEQGQLTPYPQAASGVTYAPRLSPAVAQIDWREPAAVVERKIRAYTDYPGAWTALGGKRIKVEPVVVSDLSRLAPGQILATKHQVNVGTATSEVVLNRVAPQGKAWMPAEAWARGANLFDDSHFEVNDSE